MLYQAEPGQLLNFYGKWAASTALILTARKESVYLDKTSALQPPDDVTGEDITLLVQYHKWSMILR